VKLWTKEIEKRFARTGSQDGKGFDARCVVKYFDPTGSWTLFCTEASGRYAAGDFLLGGGVFPPEGQELQDIILFGYVTGLGFPEWGYSSLAEIKATKGMLGLGMERDLYLDENATVRAAMEAIGQEVPCD